MGGVDYWRGLDVAYGLLDLSNAKQVEGDKKTFNGRLRTGRKRHENNSFLAFSHNCFDGSYRRNVH
jgi:hypothetical protein